MIKFWRNDRCHNNVKDRRHQHHQLHCFILRPKLVVLFPEIGRVKIFLSLTPRIVKCLPEYTYTFLTSKNNKQTNKQKQELKKNQKKLKKKRQYLWKIGKNK